MTRLRRSFGYGMVDQVFARVFDFATLWVVLRTLPGNDLAAYGVATAMLFMFNLLLVTPETALMRDKKRWAEQGVLQDYLRGFILFAELRIITASSAAFCVGWFWGWKSPYFFACLIAVVNQFIALAEIARLDFRIDLQQREVFRAELVLKAALLVFVSALFVYPGIQIYLGIFLTWSILGALYWTYRFRQKHGVHFNLHWPSLSYAWNAMREFAFWQHLSGIITYTVYNIDPWVLSWFETATDTISTYTVALKVSAIFFTVPMFFQSMVTIFLVNCETEDQKNRTFRRMFGWNALISAGQFVVFLIAGEWIGQLFRGDELDAASFYQFGSILCLGVFVLNVMRPFIADLVLHAPIRRLLIKLYLPVLLFSLIAYGGMTWGLGAVGCAWASAISYFLFSALLLWHGFSHGVSRKALFGSAHLRLRP